MLSFGDSFHATVFLPRLFLAPPLPSVSRVELPATGWDGMRMDSRDGFHRDWGMAWR